MKDLLKYGLIGAGAFLLARQFGLLPELQASTVGSGDAGSNAGDTGSSGDGSSGSADTGRSDDDRSGEGDSGDSSSNQSGNSERAQLLEDLKTLAGSTALNYDQWGFLYKQITNTKAPGPASVGITRTNPMPAMTPEAFLAAIGA